MPHFSPGPHLKVSGCLHGWLSKGSRANADAYLGFLVVSNVLVSLAKTSHLAKANIIGGREGVRGSLL